MKLKQAFSLLLIFTAVISLTGCDGLFRSEFQKEYIKKCEIEGKFSNKRCECFAEKMDVKFEDKTKQLILNPSDNPLKSLSLMTPFLEISKQCIAEGR